MTKPSVAWENARKGLALTLSELAIVSGYNRSVLAAMNLPLQARKISLQDFQRIMRKRQDWQERKLRQPGKDSASQPGPAGSDQKLAAADMFHGRSRKNEGKGASRPPELALLHSSA